jgi:hypothetical protein
MRVTPVVQRERDSTRKTILEDELASEARQLADTQAELRDANLLRASRGNIGDIAERLARHRDNPILGRLVEIGMHGKAYDFLGKPLAHRYAAVNHRTMPVGRLAIERYRVVYGGWDERRKPSPS